MELSGRVFVVTGGGDGIGREVVRGLLARGARVAAVDLRQEGLDATSAMVSASAIRLTTHAADVTDRDRISALPGEVIAAHGQVDGLINVAGIIQQFIPVVELDFPEIERVMDVNFWGVVNTVKAFLPHLLERPAAAIVNVSSMGALAPVPGQSVYGASKAAVKLLTEGLYAETVDTPVNVTVVFPGAISTNISGNSGVTFGGGAAVPPEALPSDDDAAASLAEPGVGPGSASGSAGGSTGGLAGALGAVKKVAGGVAGAVGGLVDRVRGKSGSDADAEQGAAFPMTSPEEAARQIIDGIEKGAYRVLIGKDASGLDKFSRLNPKGATEMIAKKMASLRN